MRPLDHPSGDEGPASADLTLHVGRYQPRDRKASGGLLGTTTAMLAFKIASAGALAASGVVTARQLQPAGRGVLVLLISIASFALVVSSLGVNVSARVQLVTPEDPVSSRDYIGLTAALALVQLFMCVAAGLTLLPSAGVRLAPWILVLFSLFGAALLVQYLLNDALNSFGFTTLATLVEAIGGGVQFLLVLLLAAVGSRTLEPFLSALLVGSGFQGLVGLVVLHRAGVAIRPSCNRASWRRLLRTGLPGIPSTLGQLLTFRVDRYLIGLFLSPSAVGLYSVASTAPELLRLPALALGQPILYRLASGSAKVSEFRRVRNVCIAGTVVLAGIMFAIAPWAVRIVFGPEYEGSIAPLRVLLLGEAGIAFFYLDCASLAGLNRLRAAAVAALAGFLVVTVLGLTLIPAFGLAGAAWASVVAYTLMGAVAALLLRRASCRQRPSP